MQCDFFKLSIVRSWEQRVVVIVFVKVVDHSSRVRSRFGRDHHTSSSIPQKVSDWICLKSRPALIIVVVLSCDKYKYRYKYIVFVPCHICMWWHHSGVDKHKYSWRVRLDLESCNCYAFSMIAFSRPHLRRLVGMCVAWPRSIAIT